MNSSVQSSKFKVQSYNCQLNRLTDRRSLDVTRENLLRELAPQVLGAVIRRFRDFAAAEDAVQEALLAAAMQWPEHGVPDNPRGWLIHVAARRMTDHIRADLARRHREAAVAIEAPVEEPPAFEIDLEAHTDRDDTLLLLFMCCHPALTRSAAIALTLRAVGGLTTAEIANAFLVPETTMAQRISRAKKTIKTSGVPFSMPDERERQARLGAVLHVLYLIFNEGYASSIGPDLQRSDLANEAIRLTRTVHRLLPDHSEVAGLLALMLGSALISATFAPGMARDPGAIRRAEAHVGEPNGDAQSRDRRCDGPRSARRSLSSEAAR
jgi:RNA polymerase sigma factor (sigma-70 family)